MVELVDNKLDFNFDVHRKNSFMYSWTKQYLEATFLAAKPFERELQGKTLYDIGLGRGRSLAVFKALGIRKVIGLEVDRQQITYALRQKERLGYDLEVIIDNKENSYLKGLPDGFCEAISIMNALNFMPEKVRENVLKEVKRTLKPGGLLIIADAAAPSLMSLLNNLCLMPRIFSNRQEFVKNLYPLELSAEVGSNYFYFINFPADLLGRIFGQQIFTLLNKVMKNLGIPPSTKTYIFKKV